MPTLSDYQAEWRLPPMWETHLEVTVLGFPVPQGSMKSFGRGRMVHSNGERLLPWRDQVQGAVMDEVRLHHRVARFAKGEPVAVEATFTVRKAANRPARRRTWPTTKPDADKLLRAVCDALTASGLIYDDAQIIDKHARKVFPDEHPLALAVPGLRLTIFRLVSGLIKENPNNGK